jgi:hypothetical protein
MAQSNKEFNSGQPIIGQLLSFIPSEVFSKAALLCDSDAKSRVINSKMHFICLFYAVLTRNSSLRELCKNITLVSKKLIAYGLTSLPCRSTLSDANAKRDSNYFAQMYQLLFEHYRSYLNSKQFSLPIGGEVDASDIEIFDSTTIALFKEILKGVGRNSLDGKKKGGIKAFTKMNLQEGVPNFVCFDAASKNENTFLKVLRLEKGSISTFDKGFCRYHYFDQMTKEEKYFVTRLKDNAKYNVIEETTELETHLGVLKDQVIELQYKHEKSTRTVQLRLVTFQDSVTNETLHFLTNLRDKKASTITLIYKNRWVIEVLFKQIKQNFELKYFLSDSENGIKSQIWVALIQNLIFTVIHKRIKEAEDFSTMVQVAAKNLCSYVHLIKFLTDTKLYARDWYKIEIEKVQLNLFSG